MPGGVCGSVDAGLLALCGHRDLDRTTSASASHCWQVMDSLTDWLTDYAGWMTDYADWLTVTDWLSDCSSRIVVLQCNAMQCTTAFPFIHLLISLLLHTKLYYAILYYINGSNLLLCFGVMVIDGAVARYNQEFREFLCAGQNQHASVFLVSESIANPCMLSESVSEWAIDWSHAHSMFLLLLC